MKINYIWVVTSVIIISMAAIIFMRSANTKTSTIMLSVPGSVSTGQILTVPLYVSADQSINAAEFYFTFPANLVEVKEIKTDKSFFTLWVKDSPVFSNEKGTIYLAGGLPTPGFAGRDGLVATVVFIAKQRGSGQISLDDNSRILLNDGLGTQLPATYQPVTLSIR